MAFTVPGERFSQFVACTIARASERQKVGGNEPRNEVDELVGDDEVNRSGNARSNAECAYHSQAQKNFLSCGYTVCTTYTRYSLRVRGVNEKEIRKYK